MKGPYSTWLTAGFEETRIELAYSSDTKVSKERQAKMATRMTRFKTDLGNALISRFSEFCLSGAAKKSVGDLQSFSENFSAENWHSIYSQMLAGNRTKVSLVNQIASTAVYCLSVGVSD